MKLFSALPVLAAALCFAAPATGLSDDHRHHWDHHDYRSGHYYHGYGYGYGYRPYYYGGYGYPFFGGPSFGVSINTSPTYYRGVDRSDSSGDDLGADVQRELAHRGFYRGEIDGDVGPGTRAAIREYQYRNGLEVTGRIDRSLLRSLDLD